jgi:transposase-like protein
MNVTVATPPKVFNGEEKQKLQQLIREGIQVMREVDSLREGLGDTVKSLAEEFEVKPAVLKKAIRAAYKADWDQIDADHVQLENILISSGMK